MKLEQENRNVVSLPVALMSLTLARARAGSAWGQPRSLALLAAGVVLGLALGMPAEAEPNGARSGIDAARGPGAVFPTVEAAVVDAQAHVRETRGPRNLGRFRAGTIYAEAGGFAYSKPIRSRDRVWSLREPVVRFKLGREDVASYIVHPSSGDSRIDRLNEAPNSAERRIVDHLDPLARPLYLITPSDRIVRYSGESASEIKQDAPGEASVSQLEPAISIDAAEPS